MSRSRKSARQAGSKFERSIADVLAEHVDDRIDRRVKSGAKDRGDIGGLRSAHGQRVVVECKNVRGVQLGSWYAEADVERGNDDAEIALVAHKRHGTADPLEQWVTCTVRDLIALVTGVRAGGAQ